MLYNSVAKSIIKFVKTEVIPDLAILGANYRLLDWDSHATMNELDEVDLLGPEAFGAVYEDQDLALSFAISYSTVDDVGLYRMRDTTDYLFDRLAPEKTIKVFSDTNGQDLGFIVLLDGTTAAPIAKTTSRPYQFVSVSGLFSRSA